MRKVTSCFRLEMFYQLENKVFILFALFIFFHFQMSCRQITHTGSNKNQKRKPEVGRTGNQNRRK